MLRQDCIRVIDAGIIAPAKANCIIDFNRSVYVALNDRDLPELRPEV